MAAMTAWSQAPPPAAVFGALPAIGDASLSPDGARIVWSDQSQDSTVKVVVVELGSGKLLRQIAVGMEYKLRNLQWADDQTILMTLSQTEAAGSTNDSRYRREMYRTIAVDLSTGQATILLMTGGARGLVNSGRIESLQAAKPGTVIMSTLDFSANAVRDVTDTRFERKRGDSGWVSVLFEVDVRTGKGKAIERGTAYTDQWIVDGAGNCVGRSEWNPEGSGYKILAKQGNAFKEIFARPKGPTLEIHGVNATRTAIVAVGPDDKDRRVVFEIALDGSGAKTVYEHPQLEVDDLIKDRFTGVPVGVALEGAQRERHWLSPEAKARHEAAARAFKGRNVDVYDQSRDGKRVLTRVDGASEPAVYYLIDYTRRSADIVNEEYPALANAKLGQSRALQYKSRDGVDIPAILTLPPGSSGRNHALVVMPHGGPNAHDELRFDWWVQFLATRGYAVLQPQFRGSTGYGRAFETAGYGQWGLRMQDDVSDGVRAMVAEGVADPARVCIVGASYGGYAALAGLAFTPELYRCAVSYAGISNIPQMLASDRTRYGEDNPDYLELERRVGMPLDPVLAQRSPINAADRIKAPLLLLHGLDDIIVPAAQSELLARVLSERGAPVRYVKLPGEDHWLSRAGTRRQLLTEIEKFLAEHLPP
jgi:dienelactone hydrolase